MIYHLAHLNLKKEFLFDVINEELKSHNIPLVFSDEQDTKGHWNIYDYFDLRAVNPKWTPKFPNDISTDGFMNHVILEYTEDSNAFCSKKFWIILRSRNYYPGNPYFEEIKGQYIWDSTKTSCQELIKLIKDYERVELNCEMHEYEEYMKHRYDEELNCEGSAYDEEECNRQFNSLMDDNDAWGNIE